MLYMNDVQIVRLLIAYRHTLRHEKLTTYSYIIGWKAIVLDDVIAVKNQ